MKIKSQRDFWSGLMFVAVGLGFAWGATFYRFGDSARPGPGFFPFGLGLLTALLGLILLFKALSVERVDGDPIGAFAWRPLGCIVGAALAGDEFRWAEALVNALVLTLLSWVVFIWGLKLAIPIAPWLIGS